MRIGKCPVRNDRNPESFHGRNDPWDVVRTSESTLEGCAKVADSRSHVHASVHVEDRW